MSRGKKLCNMTQEEIDNLSIDEFSRALADDAFDRAKKAGELDKLFAILDKLTDDPEERRRKIK